MINDPRELDPLVEVKEIYVKISQTEERIKKLVGDLVPVIAGNVAITGMIFDKEGQIKIREGQKVNLIQLLKTIGYSEPEILEKIELIDNSINFIKANNVAGMPEKSKT